MKSVSVYELFIALTLLSFLSAEAQTVNRTGFDGLMPKRARYVPALDSSIDVSKLSKPSRDRLIDKLFGVDQMYRVELSKAGFDTRKHDHFSLMLSINDPVNRTLLFKIIKIDGWPCDCKNGENSLSMKAWFIPWHARGNYTELIKFYPYMVKAAKAGCMNRNQFDQIDRAIKHLYAIGYR